jgi:hypothetical protein
LLKWAPTPVASCFFLHLHCLSALTRHRTHHPPDITSLSCMGKFWLEDDCACRLKNFVTLKLGNSSYLLKHFFYFNFFLAFCHQKCSPRINRPR